MSEITTKYDPERRIYKISGCIDVADILLDPVDIVRQVRDEILDTLIADAKTKLQERFESELNKALDTMFSEEM